MTKVTIIGENKQEQTKKPIEFVKFLNDIIMSGDYVKPAKTSPHEFLNIELICKNYSGGLDLMFCYNDDRDDQSKHQIAFGYFNDGVV